MSEQAGRYQRSAMGMVGAMIVLLALIGAYVALRAINRTEPASPVRAVEYQQTLDYARQQADFPVLAPAELPSGWRATSVSFVPEPVRWHLGLLTDQDRYVGIEQSHLSLREMVDTYVDAEARRGRVVEVDGESWRIWTDSGGDTALTQEREGVTTLVVGSVGLSKLEDFAADLR